MKRLFLPSFAVVSVTLLLAACENPQPPPQQPHKHPGFNSAPQVGEADDHGGHADATEPPHGEAETKPEHTAPDSNPAATQPKVGNFEYGKAVPGKPGFVTSPYAPYAGYVDVRGFTPGTEVKDPYTGKTFLVP